ncbi:MAG: RNA polymerase sigma factor [Verrucomicrobiae bacterium]|nr:RNA polymerase sigma factor [Verrucomicrobiae bacterium]
MVYQTCVRFLGNVQEAEETCQDIFLRVHEKLHQFEGRSTFKTWLFRVVYNHCMTRRRQLAIRRERGAAVEEELTRETEEMRAEEFLADNDLSENVNRAIERLRPDDKEVIVLRFVSDLSLDDISEVLGLGLSATKMRLYRAMDRFKTLYENAEGAN